MIKTIIGSILIICIIIFAPLLSIWALNTLFGLAIGYTFMTWFAMFWITMIIASREVNMNG